MGWRLSIATAKLDVSGMEPGQVGGLCHHSGVYFLLGVRAEEDGTRRLFFNRNGRKVTDGPEIETDVIWMRTQVDAATAFFEYSTDGETYHRFGDEFQVKFGRWRGDRMGFFCWNTERPAGHIDVDWYRYRYHGPKGGLD
jgi:beta-xylosidase